MKIKDNTTILDTDFENILKIMQEFKCIYNTL
jgi:hypothetical protein